MRAIAFAFLAVLSGACAMFEPPAPASEAAPSVAASAGAASRAEELVGYLARVRAMSEGALAAEAARQKREAGDLAKLKAAIALSLSPQAEEADILALVDPALKSSDRDVRAMASFLHTMATERRRLRESAAAANARLREEKRAAETQKQRADTLQQKLDALTELEKSLSDRSSPSR
jgi:hypothetical protein